MREVIERQPPGQHRDDEHAERGDERARVENQRGKHEAGGRQHDRRGAGGLQQADDQLAGEGTTVRS